MHNAFEEEFGAGASDVEAITPGEGPVLSPSSLVQSAANTTAAPVTTMQSSVTATQTNAMAVQMAIMENFVKVVNNVWSSPIESDPSPAPVLGESAASPCPKHRRKKSRVQGREFTATTEHRRTGIATLRTVTPLQETPPLPVRPSPVPPLPVQKTSRRELIKVGAADNTHQRQQWYTLV